MKWEVEGAERATGRTVKVVVEAAGEEDAVRVANERGLLVAGVRAAGERLKPALSLAELDERLKADAAAALASSAEGGTAAGADADADAVRLSLQELDERVNRYAAALRADAEAPPVSQNRSSATARPTVASLAGMAGAPAGGVPSGAGVAAAPGAAAAANAVPVSLEYRRPAEPDAMPTYPQIVTGARVLNVVSLLLLLVALGAFLVSGAAFVEVATGGRGGVSLARLVAAGLAALVPGTYGVAVLVAALVLRMLAGLALAVRDIARNTYRTAELLR